MQLNDYTARRGLAGALDLLQNIGCLGGPGKRIGVVVVFVDVVAARKGGGYFRMTFSKRFSPVCTSFP